MEIIKQNYQRGLFIPQHGKKSEIYEEFGELPAMEIERVELFEELPTSWTYPRIQPVLLEAVDIYISRIKRDMIGAFHMNKKNLGRRAITVLSIVVVLIGSILIYNRWNMFEFTDELYGSSRVYLKKCMPFSEEDYKEIVIEEQVKEELLELIINRPYYKWNMEGYRGYSSYGEDSRSGTELEIIRIGIISSNYDKDKLHYEYWISNTGQLEIRNVYKGVSHFYSLRKFPSAWLDIEGKDTKVLYNQLEQLIH